MRKRRESESDERRSARLETRVRQRRDDAATEEDAMDAARRSIENHGA
jgi:hypothetical protein